MAQIDAATLKERMAHCTGGTENWWAHWLAPITYTDGVRMVATDAGAWWLIDDIASYYPMLKKKHPEALEFSLWELKKAADGAKPDAYLFCRLDKGEPAIVAHEIPITDFPLDQLKLYLAAGGPNGWPVLMLPEEY